MKEITMQDLRNEVNAELSRIRDEINNCQEHNDCHGEDMARASAAALNYIIRIIDGNES